MTRSTLAVLRPVRLELSTYFLKGLSVQVSGILNKFSKKSKNGKKCDTTIS